MTAAEVMLCAGTGGVGKTTVAAALGVKAAAEGKRVAVITVDPARRLADAVGLELANEPQQIAGEWPGELWAMMLDAKATFDALVTREASSPEQVERILSNRLYQNLSGVLSGTQEFMANEKLFELHQSGRFDLIVVDTPPTRNALDFLEAPEKLVGFLDGKLMRLLFPRTVRRAVNAGLRLMLRQVSSIVGSKIVEDGEAFLKAFQGMEDGFRERAHQVTELLASDATAVMLVTTPNAETAPETQWFEREVTKRGLKVDGIVINQVRPSFSGRSASELQAIETQTLLVPALDLLIRNQQAVETERIIIENLAVLANGHGVFEVPLLPEAVHDLPGVTEVAKHLS